MASQHSNQLTHEEAFELLPWHVNASLDELLDKQVAEHIDHCERCQQEAALLGNTIVAINSEEPGYGQVDEQFQALMQRIEQSETNSPTINFSGFGNRVRAWLSKLSIPAPTYIKTAGATAGLLLLVAILFVTLRPSEPDITAGDYRVLSTIQANQLPLQLVLHLNQTVTMEQMQQLTRSLVETLDLRKDPGNAKRYFVTLPANTQAGDVNQLLKTLKADTRIQRIEIVTD